MADKIITILGKVSLTPRGQYDATVEYETLDIMTHNGSSFLVLKAFQGVEPIGDNETTMLLSAKGKDLKFSDLTPEEVERLKLHFSDLAENEIALLQEPAKEATVAANRAASEATAATLAANTSIGKANEATTKALDAAKAAEGIVSTIRPDYNVDDKTLSTFIANKPEIPTLEIRPLPTTKTYVNSYGNTIKFRVGDRIKSVVSDVVLYYVVVDILADGSVTWMKDLRDDALHIKNKKDIVKNKTYSLYAEEDNTSDYIAVETADHVDLLESLYAYGIEWDTTNPDPSCTRICNLDLHKTLPLQSKMKRCVLATNAEFCTLKNTTNNPVQYYLDESDSTKQKEYKKYEIVKNPYLNQAINFPTIITYNDDGIVVRYYQPYYKHQPSYIFKGLTVGEHVESDVSGYSAAAKPFIVGSVPGRNGDCTESEIIKLSEHFSDNFMRVSFDITEEMLENNRVIGIFPTGEITGNPNGGYTIKYTNKLPANLDGSDGNVMVELPEHYIRFEIDGTKRRVKLSERYIPGYEHRPLKYIAAFYSQRDNTTGALMSVVNSTTRFRGGNAEEITWDDLPKTRIGKPSVNSFDSATPEIIKNNSTEFKGYSHMSLVARETLHWFCTIEYATFNYKLPFNAEKTSEGYAQGGIGAGCIGIPVATLNTHYSGNTPINNGATVSLGNKTGEILYNEDLLGIPLKCNNYRGVENMCSNLQTYLHNVTAYTKLSEPSTMNIAASLDIQTSATVFTTKTTNNYGMRLNFDILSHTFTDKDETSSSANTYTCSWSKIIRWSVDHTPSPYRIGTTISDITNTSSLLNGGVERYGSVIFPLIGSRMSYTTNSKI